MIYLIS